MSKEIVDRIKVLASVIKFAMDAKGPPPWTNNNAVPEEVVDGDEEGREEEEEKKLDNEDRGCTRLLMAPRSAPIDPLADEW